MKDFEINGINALNWRGNSVELAKLQGLEDEAILILPPKIGKMKMLRIAHNLDAARKGERPLSDGQI
ncbi:hypothetical protein [Vibrio anguillarum]|uniref:hypothetical protein n=1 Tax=Vibrio anguillarum TaxID=55601 RepID=UPI000BB46CD8|nr:hypothetical protein [Vibrio anguillarum]ATC60102.1 hypothetical protein CMV05_22110 [Vibrio anguillarum]MBF4252785.1 hypothetical protein [Vibrio anguillarum]MBF4341597.1 hypothetical protein [Vibrio anguillarum]